MIRLNRARASAAEKVSAALLPSGGEIGVALRRSITGQQIAGKKKLFHPGGLIQVKAVARAACEVMDMPGRPPKPREISPNRQKLVERLLCELETHRASNEREAAERRIGGPISDAPSAALQDGGDQPAKA